LKSTLKIESKILEGIKIVLFKLGNLKKNETLCVVSDSSTNILGNYFVEVAKGNCDKIHHCKIKSLVMHGDEPPNDVAHKMKQSNLILGLTENSMAHTKARLRATNSGSRYMSLPDYSFDILGHPSLRTDFKKCGKKAELFTQLFTKGKSVQVKTEKGTKIDLDIISRKGNFCPGYVDSDVLLGSPPNAEANIAPIEFNSNGTIVVDGSIPISGIGKLSDDITLQIKDGRIETVKGDKHVKNFLNKLFKKYGDKSRVLAELGVGCNKNASLCGNMLIDEGSNGTIHFGFGSNSTIGGSNEINFHLDFVLLAKQLIIDGKSYKIGEIELDKMNVEKTVIEYFKSKGFLPEQSKNDYSQINYLDSGIIDSMQLVEMIVFLEDELGIKFTSKELQSNEFRTIGGLINIINLWMQQNSN